MFLFILLYSNKVITKYNFISTKKSLIKNYVHYKRVQNIEMNSEFFMLYLFIKLSLRSLEA